MFDANKIKVIIENLLVGGFEIFRLVPKPSATDQQITALISSHGFALKKSS